MRNRDTVTETMRYRDDRVIYPDRSKDAVADQALVVGVPSANNKRVPK
jgi:hypothetical protein